MKTTRSPLSSTAIVLQTLAEKGLLQTTGGQSAFSVLLFQDIIVIPMLAVMPLLATAHVELAGDEHHAAETWISTLPGWARALAVLGAVVGIIVAGLFHSLNLALGVFSPTIQALRLHYVEFFGKFYQGDGTPFRPFGSVERKG